MAIVTGTIRQFNQNVFPQSAAFRLKFTPSGPGVSAAASFWGPPVFVSPATDGTFSVHLVETTLLVPDVWFEVSAEWLDAEGNFTGVQFPGWKLRVPQGGGDLQDLMQVPADATLVWFGTTPPDDPKTFVGWVDTSTVLPDGTMPYYEWE